MHIIMKEATIATTEKLVNILNAKKTPVLLNNEYMRLPQKSKICKS